MITRLLRGQLKTLLTVSFDELEKENYHQLKGILARSALPQATRQFMGREEVLKEMAQQLQVEKSWGEPTRTVILRGFGGAGKTQLSGPTGW